MKKKNTKTDYNRLARIEQNARRLTIEKKRIKTKLEKKQREN